MRIAGIDGYNGGWIAVIVDSDDFPSASVAWSEDLKELFTNNSIELGIVDIPIGLTSGPADRNVEKAARTALPKKASSVFNTPCRQAMCAASYEDACRENQTTLKKKFSKQTWAIMPKIKEAEIVVRALGQDRVREGHPEVSFATIEGQPIHASKISVTGLLTRIGVISRIGFDLSRLSEHLPDNHPAKPDDLIDAAILAWTASRVTNNQHKSFPEAPDKDATGLEMAIFA